MSFLRITPFAVAVLVVVTIAGTAHAQRKICAPQGCWIEPTAVVPVAPAAIRPVNTLPIPAVKVWIDLDATPQETIFTSANGVVISESEAETLIVTNAHVITQAEQVRIGTTPAEIVFSDAITDLAFLRVEGRLPNTGVARIRATELGFGEPCWYYGYLPPSWNLGYMKGRRLRRDEIRWLTISLVSREGMSGGGVYDDAGQLVGILSRGFQADTQVVPVSMVMDLLNRYRQSQQPDQLTDVERRQKELFDALQATRAELERMKETPKLVIPDDRPDLIEPWPGEGNSPGVIGEVVKVPADPGMPPVEQRPHSAPGGTLWGRAKGWAWDSLSGWMWGAIGASVAGPIGYVIARAAGRRVHERVTGRVRKRKEQRSTERTVAESVSDEQPAAVATVTISNYFNDSEIRTLADAMSQKEVPAPATKASTSAGDIVFPTQPIDYSKIWTDHMAADGVNPVNKAQELGLYVEAFEAVEKGVIQIPELTDPASLIRSLRKWVNNEFRKVHQSQTMNRSNIHHKAFYAFLHEKAVKLLRDGTFNSFPQHRQAAEAIEEWIDASLVERQFSLAS